MKIHEVLGGLHMNNTMQYKGYVGNVEFSEEDGIYYGKIVGIRSLVSYEGESLKALRNDFHEAVDDYMEFCRLKDILEDSPTVQD